MPKKQKYGTQITAEARDGVAYIRIVDIISEYELASSRETRKIVDLAITAGVKEADVYINSRGGDCFESAEIANELARFETVNIRVGAVAASAATYLVARFNASSKPNSQFMLHRPRLGTYGDIVRIQADIKLLENTTADYKTCYAKRMGITEDEVETLWANGDVWLTAQEALKLKLISSIEETEDLTISAEDRTLLEAVGAPVIPEKPIEKPIENKVDKLKLIAALGLSTDATDEQIEEAVKEVKQAADTAKAVMASAETDLNSKVEALVDKAITADKKITADQKQHYVKLATADYDSTKAVLDAMSPIAKLSAQTKPQLSKEEQAERKGWTLEDYLEKDTAAYAQMKEADPEKAARLEAAYFGTK